MRTHTCEYEDIYASMRTHIYETYIREYEDTYKYLSGRGGPPLLRELSEELGIAVERWHVRGVVQQRLFEQRLIRQHTSSYVCVREVVQRLFFCRATHTLAYVSIR